jgi:F-type H+-transporting ATPase subunit b
MIDLLPNSTLPLMWGIFLVVLIVLNKLVFQPTLKIIEARRNQTDALAGDAVSLIQKSQEALATYEKKIAAARVEAARSREAIIQEARKEEAQLVARARKENEGVLEEMKSQLDSERKEAMMKLKQYAQELAKSMANKILEKKVA